MLFNLRFKIRLLSPPGTAAVSFPVPQSILRVVGTEENVNIGFLLLEHLVRRFTQIGTGELEGNKGKGGGPVRHAGEAWIERKVGEEERQ